jgi:hypothetical protein
LIETAHFEIHTTLLEPLILGRLAAFMETALQEYQKQLPSPIEIRQRMTLYLFGDRKQWESFTDVFAGPQAPIYRQIQKGAYCLKDTCVAYHIGIEQTFSALAHEGWHQFTGRHFVYRLPSFLDEGIATLFETFEQQDGRFVFRPDRNTGRLGTLKINLQQGRLIPLSTLIELNPGQVLDNSEPATAFYSQAHALVRFLRENNHELDIRAYQQMLYDALKGSWPVSEELGRTLSDRRVPMTARLNRELAPQLFSRYIHADIDRLQGPFESYCRRISQPILIKSQICPVVQIQQPL